jgi:hypothetical protein
MEHTQAEMEEIRKGYILECLIKPWRYYKKVGTLTFGITPMSIIYKTLTEDLKIIELNLEDKKRIYNIALEKVEQTLERKVQNMDEYKKLQFDKEQVAKLGIKKAMDHEIKSICYELTVKEFITDCYKKNVDFEKMICDKTNYKF